MRTFDAMPSLLTQTFDGDRITTLRHAVTRCAANAGLVGQRLEDFVLAVNEIVTNAVRHAGGRGLLKLWVQEATLRCAVVDAGEGIPDERLNGHELPPSFAVSGRGLWLARHLCDNVLVETGNAGTAITLLMALNQSAT